MAKLFFYYAAMNAGKTTALLQASYNYQERGMDTLVFLPVFDNRAGVGTVSSRVGLKGQAITFDDTFDFLSFIQRYRLQHPRLRCVLIDEAQFLSRQQVRQLCDVVDQLALPVLAYGLRTDFLGNSFAGSQALLEWAEELVEIKTICHCGRKATMNARIDKDGRQVTQGAQIEIGGNERYIALCRRHFNQGDLQTMIPFESQPYRHSSKE